MRSIEKSKTLIYAAHVASQEDVLSGDYASGDVATTYATPVSFNATIHPLTNSLTRMAYGVSAASTSRIVLAKGDHMPFTFAPDKRDVLWVGVTPNGVLVDTGAMNHTHTVEEIIDTGEQLEIVVRKRA